MGVAHARWGRAPIREPPRCRREGSTERAWVPLGCESAHKVPQKQKSTEGGPTFARALGLHDEGTADGAAGRKPAKELPGGRAHNEQRDDPMFHSDLVAPRGKREGKSQVRPQKPG